MKGNQIISHGHSLSECQFINTLKPSEKAPTFAAKDVEEGFVIVVLMTIHMANAHHVFVHLLIFISRCHGSFQMFLHRHQKCLHSNYQKKV